MQINGKYYYPLKPTEVNINTKYDDMTNFNRAENAGVTFGGKTKKKTKKRLANLKKSSKKKRKTIKKQNKRNTTLYIYICLF